MAMTSGHASATLGKMYTFHLLEWQASFCQACDASLGEGETPGGAAPACLSLDSPASAAPQLGARRRGQSWLGADGFTRGAPGEGQDFDLYPSTLGRGARVRRLHKPERAG